MASYLEFQLELPIGRLWRLNVRKKNVQTEYIVPDAQLAKLISSIVWDRNIQDLQCVPYDSSAHEGVWMTSRSPLEAAA